MSRGDLQEMEVGTKQSKTAVNATAKAGDPMPRLADPNTQLGSVEDLGGPTPENYRSDDDSAKLKTPGTTLKQVRDVVNKGAKSADPMKSVKEEAEEEAEELLEAKHKEEKEEEAKANQWDLRDNVILVVNMGFRQGSAYTARVNQRAKAFNRQSATVVAIVDT